MVRAQDTVAHALGQAGRRVRRLRRALRQRTSPAFIDAYVDSIAQRVPILYLVVVFDVILLDFSYCRVAPLPIELFGVVLAAVAGLR
eukprot:gene18203-23016_t